MSQVDWELIARCQAGACNPAEREWMERMMAAHPELADAAAAMRDVIRDADTGVSPERLSAHLAAIKGSGPPVGVRRGRVRSALRFPVITRRTGSLAAAAGFVALLFGGGALARRMLGEKEQPTP